MKPANLFFTELIIVLLFFSFSAAVILGIFASADNCQRRSDLVENALICSQSIAEAFAVTGDFSETSEIVFGGNTGNFDGHATEIHLDSEMKPCQDGEIILYMSQLSEKNDAGILECLTFEFRTDEGLLFTPVVCSSYFPDKGGAEDE